MSRATKCSTLGNSGVAHELTKLVRQIKKEAVMPVSNQVNIADAKAHLSELIVRAARGEEIVIARRGKPQARLLPLASKESRIPGRGASEWEIVGNIHEPLPEELIAAFEGRSE